MAQRTISNRDNLQERNRVENRIWDAINRLENAIAPNRLENAIAPNRLENAIAPNRLANAIAPAVIQQIVNATATQVAQQAVTSPTGIVYLVENNGGGIVYDEEGHAKLYPYQIGG